MSTLVSASARPGLLAVSSVFALLIVGAVGTSCGLFTGPDAFVVRVDSLQAPPSIGPTESAEVRFFGRVGSDACSRLSHVEKRRNLDSLVVRFHAERVSGNCILVPTELDHTEVLRPPYANTFIVAALQPNGPPLIRVIPIQ